MSEGLDIQALTQNFVEVVSTWGLRIVGAVAVFVLGRMIAGGFRRQIRRALAARGVDPTLSPFLSGMAYYLVITFTVIAVINLFGVPTTSILAVLGAAGLAVGLALQGTLSNFASGVMLLVFRPFKVGDYVEAGGTAGSVLEIAIFTTQLNTPDNVRIIVPNATIWGSTVKNYATNDTRRNDMVVGISYSDDIGKATAVIERVLEADSRVLKDPAPLIAVSELADSSVNIAVRPWCRKEDYGALRFDLTRTFKEELEAAGCSIPFPQRDVHLFREGATAE